MNKDYNSVTKDYTTFIILLFLAIILGSIVVGAGIEIFKLVALIKYVWS